MRRLDWQLIHPDGEGNLDESLQMMRLIRRLATKAGRGPLSGDDFELLAATEAAYYEETLSHCDAVEAPLIEAHPEWEPRIIDEYADGDSDLELEEYLELRRREPDCAHCPFVSPYSLYPMNPCEFSAGALEELLTDPDLIKRLGLPMKPAAMKTLAVALEAALSQGEWRPFGGLDSKDYIQKAVLFLRFWADQGFGLLPTDVDRVIAYGAEEEGPPPPDGSDLLH